MAETLLTTVTYGSGIEIKVYAEQTDAGVLFRVQSTGTDQHYDINGLFVDLGNDGGAITAASAEYDFKGAQSINLTGADSFDGTKFDGWDSVFALGRAGLKDGSVQAATEDLNGDRLFISGLTLEDLAGAQVGLRITSVESLGGGSLKLANEVPDDFPPPPENNFPDSPPGPISEITLYFNTTDGDTNGDGVYTVKIDAVQAPDQDLDSFFGDIVAYLTQNDPVVAANAGDLLGATVQYGSEPAQFYAIDNNPDADPLPDPPGEIVTVADNTYDYTDIFGSHE